MASPQQGDLRLLGSPSGQRAGGGARTRVRRVPADLRADSLITVLPTPQKTRYKNYNVIGENINERSFGFSFHETKATILRDWCPIVDQLVVTKQVAKLGHVSSLCSST
ncbi:hypothetical protein PoB_003772400 [Plakobranchus ocellatus]|uniref:Uncharacterized protein n=1 Tax=Plakobranchus ocellatus TaxID=259542 RepID=A0AAV4AYK6_9GAST|nr:hypothetical protein PoB_003772400 [Plakobranchus ocellatus]